MLLKLAVVFLTVTYATGSGSTTDADIQILTTNSPAASHEQRHG
uniref:Uncharacterized protein n=1 Tax=Ciona savignyi TaxID=51511 RepID=H2YB97_CIOSA